MKGTKSVRLKKYGSVYNTHFVSEKKVKNSSFIAKESRLPKAKNPVREPKNPVREPKNPVREPKNPVREPKNPVRESGKTSKRSLNEYQKFVKEQSSKDKYKNMKGSDRMVIISKEWERHKRRNGRSNLKRL
jgi:hypothetical protein